MDKPLKQTRILWLKGEGHAKINNNFFHKYTLWHMLLTEKNVRTFLSLPFAQEMNFFSTFLHGVNSESKNSSVVGGATVYMTSQQERTLGSLLTGR